MKVNYTYSKNFIKNKKKKIHETIKTQIKNSNESTFFK